VQAILLHGTLYACAVDPVESLRPPCDMSAPVDTTDETANSGTPEADSSGSVLETIMFTDIEGSVALQQMLGTQRYASLITRHGELFFDALTSAHAGKIEKHTGDGFMARFEDPTRAVEVSLRFLWSLRHEDWGIKRGLRVRIGIHQGEVLTLQHNRTLPEAIGAGVNIAARVMGMAEGSQVLMTKGVFDAARQSLTCISGIPPKSQGPLRWEAHGSYLMKGIDGTIEIFEVGEKAHGSFQRPKSGGDVQRSVSAEAEATLGWRPAADMEVPKRTGWFLVKLLGEGGFGEVWLAENRSTREPRVFKFCFDPLRLRSFKRELTLFRLIRDNLGEEEIAKRQKVVDELVQGKSAEDASFVKLTEIFQTIAAERKSLDKTLKGLTAKDMAVDIGVPFHKGAVRYYKEVGAM